MNENAARRLTLISAPAGYGKTTLAVQWAAQDPHSAVWLSVDSSENDIERFIRYLASAIGVRFPGFGTGIASLLTSPALAPPQYLADTMISDLSMTDRPFSVVIDDYHKIGDESVHKIMIRMIQHLPPNLHLVILTRMDPPWPLGLFRVRGWLGELRAADLRFSRDEARIFFNPDRKQTVSDSVVNMLHGKTEGWVAGLQLARLSMANAQTPDAFAREFSDNDRLIVDFLVEEVISRQPLEIRNFFAVTAVLDRFCAPLCDRLLPEGYDSSSLIAEAERRNLFIVPIDNEGIWFRYHHLFQKLLTRLNNTDQTPERKRRLHYLAGEWFAENGLIEDALKHLIASGEMDAAARLFGENLHTVIEKDITRRTLDRWVNMFPDDVKNERPELLVAQICSKTFHWDLPGMLPLMNKAEALLRNPVCTIAEPMRRQLMAYIDTFRGFYLYWHSDAKGALRHIQRALAVLPREHSWAHAVGIMYLGGSLAAIGRLEEALAFLEDAVSKDCREGSRNVGMILAARMAVLLHAGNLTAVKETAHQVLKLLDTVPVPVYWQCHAHYFLGSVAYEQNFLGVAADHFGHVEQLIYKVNSRVYHECLIGLALVSQARQEPAKALDYADKARSFTIQMNDAISRQMSESLITRLAVLSGKKLADPISLTVSNDASKPWMEIPSLTLVEYLIRKFEPDCRSTFPIIEDALKQAKQHHNTRQVIQFLAAKSVALKCAGKVSQAFETLEETLRMAEPLGFVRSFVDRGPIMAELLNGLPGNGSETPYVRHILGAFAKIASDKRPAAPYSDMTYKSLLTKREAEILKMLVKRMTYKEIADRAFISPETVKSHATSIYRKLKVSGRRQAIGTAKEKGFLLERNR